MIFIKTLQKVLKQGLIIVLMKDELGRKIMIEFVGSRSKTYSYLMDDGSEDKKSKRHKKSVIKRKLKFEIIKTV